MLGTSKGRIFLIILLSLAGLICSSLQYNLVYFFVSIVIGLLVYFSDSSVIDELKHRVDFSINSILSQSENIRENKNKSLKTAEEVNEIKKEINDVKAFLANLGYKEEVNPRINQKIKQFQIEEVGLTPEQAIQSIKQLGHSHLQLDNQVISLFKIAKNYHLTEYKRHKARNFYKKAITLCNRINNKQKKAELEASIYHNLGILEREEGNLDVAINFYNKSIKSYRKVENKWGEGMINMLLGFVYGQRGDSNLSSDYNLKALRIFKGIDFLWGIINCETNIGITLLQKGELLRAVEHFESAIRIATRSKYNELKADAYLNLGTAYKDMARDLTGGEAIDDNKFKEYFEMATKSLETSINIYKTLKDQKGIAYGLANLGHTYALIKEYQKARSYYDEALSIFNKIQNYRGISSEMSHIGLGYMGEGNFKLARHYFNESIRISTEHEYTFGMANGYFFLSQLEYNEGNINETVKYATKSIELFEEIGNKLKVQMVKKAYSQFGIDL